MQRRFKIMAACGGLFVAIGLLILIFMRGQRDDAENKIIYGVACLENGKLTGVNVDKRFSMHSVMKFPQALYVAHVMKERSISLEDTVSVIKSELTPCTWSPMLSMIEEKQIFSYSELLRLSLQQSDNNACDLLFAHFGMPKEVEGYIRSLGFSNIHIRATEQQMAKNHDLARENYCTPREITRLMEWFYEHHEDDEYLDFIWNTMLECRTGIERLPSLTSEGDRIVHKTGTGFANENGSMDRNDVGVIIRADTATTIVSVFVPYSNDESDVADILRASGL